MKPSHREKVRRRHVVCREDELPPGSMKLVPIGKFGVGVFNVNGTYRGLTNYCPHEGGPLCAGNVRGTTETCPDSPAGLRWIREGEIVRCPWHQWEFDIATGETLAVPKRGIRTYTVEVVDGMVSLVL